MRVMIVDDEPLACQRMESLLTKFDLIEGVQTFLSPAEALSWSQKQKVDIAFLDIEMPEMSGLELGDRLLNHNPELNVVFVTAYNEYAVEAFEINAMDYILKPVQEKRLSKSLTKVLYRRGKPDISVQQKEQDTLLCVLQNISCFDQVKGLHTIHWRTAKAQEFFAYLLHHRQQAVHKDKIIELLWPDADVEKATSLLHTTVYQVRKTIYDLGFDIKIKYNDRSYVLHYGDVKLDVEVWEEGIKLLPPISRASIAQHQEMIDLYRGDYLGDHPFIWAEAEQERLRLLWLEHVKKVAAYYIEIEKYTDALMCYKQIQERYPYVEEGYLGAMKIHAHLGYHAEVKKQYEKMKECFQQDLGVMPSAEVQSWYNGWLESKPQS